MRLTYHLHRSNPSCLVGSEEGRRLSSHGSLPGKSIGCALGVGGGEGRR
jgi:hypothetical protein